MFTSITKWSEAATNYNNLKVEKLINIFHIEGGPLIRINVDSVM